MKDIKPLFARGPELSRETAYYGTLQLSGYPNRAGNRILPIRYPAYSAIPTNAVPNR
jgi:hypothetical protein